LPIIAIFIADFLITCLRRFAFLEVVIASCLQQELP
jgi:hypothetical protein